MVHKNKDFDILVCDDEKNITDGIQTILEEEGYRVHSLNHAEEVVEKTFQMNPDLLILDVWMPNIDGRMILKELQKINKRATRKKKDDNDLLKTKIIMISGHLGMEHSAELMRLGAMDLLEKPFNADALIKKVQGALGVTEKEQSAAILEKQEFFLRTTDYSQKTIKRSVLAKGIGIHSGYNTGIILSPMPKNSGVIFEDISSGESFRAHLENVFSTNYSTNLKKNDFEIKVVEHILSTLYAYGIDNIKIKGSREIPIFDGSAKKFCELIDSAGVLELEENKRVFPITQTIRYQDPIDSGKTIVIEPFDGFAVDYQLIISESFGSQRFCIEMPKNLEKWGEVFKEQIAPSRTFGFINETKNLQSSGLAQGAKLDNALLLDGSRVVNAELLFDNEFARHKVLDIMGDFYLTGYTLLGKITARGTGHRHNIKLLKKLIATLAND